MNETQAIYEEKETLSVDVFLPERKVRTATPLFHHTRDSLLKMETGCYICGTKENLEAHHSPVEHSEMNSTDWALIATDAANGEIGFTQRQRDAAKAFDFADIEKDPERFVDDMRVNGLLLCKSHHIGKDEGIHCMPHSLWIAQKYAKEGYQFSKIEKIHHE